MDYKCFLRWLNVFLLVWMTSSSFAQDLNAKKPDVYAKQLLTSFDSYYRYEYYTLKLNDPYTASDDVGHAISRKTFLESLASGKYLPLKYASSGHVDYRLYKLPASTNPDIIKSLKAYGRQYVKYFHFEGKPLPDFDFLDINGRRYTALNMKGKILVLKCWFVHCQACNEEIPALNEIVKKYRDRKDIVFIGLAIDSKKKLKAFLNKTSMNYSAVPDKKSYMEDQLKVDLYPTHFIVDRKGNIARVLENADQLASELSREAGK